MPENFEKLTNHLVVKADVFVIFKGLNKHG